MRQWMAVWVPVAVGMAACGPPHNTDPGYAGHSIYLPLLGTGHDPDAGTGVTCDSCHPGTTFTEFTCSSSTCHTPLQTDPQHPNVAGYSADAGTDSCFGCHYHPLFPIGGTQKHGTQCPACHIEQSQTADVNTLQCAQCHAGLGVDAQHSNAGIVDYSPTSPLCLRCHAGSVVTLVASHPTGEATFVGNRHHPEQCLTCHPGVLATPVNSIGTTWAADWKSQGCSTCHGGGGSGG